MWYTAVKGGPDRHLASRHRHLGRRDHLDQASGPDSRGGKPWEGDNVYLPEVVLEGAAPCGTSGEVTGRIGYAVSPDGIHWGKWPGNPVLAPPRSGATRSPCGRRGRHRPRLGLLLRRHPAPHISTRVVFFDAFETGDTTVWNTVVP